MVSMTKTFDDKLLNLFGNDDVFNSYLAAKNVEIGEDLAEKNVEEGKLINDMILKTCWTQSLRT